MTPARQAATDVLLAVERGRTTLAAAVERARGGLTDERNRALVLELAAGTCRWRAALDAVLAQASQRPLADLDAQVRAVLRLATYQLLYLDRIPAHAVVHEAVESARALGQAHAAGFVNAVLRAVQQSGGRGLPPRPADDAPGDAWRRYLSTTLSHPAWLVDRWIARIGVGRTERWCTFNNTRPEPTVRSAGRLSVETLAAALTAAGVPNAPSPFLASALRLDAGTLGRLPAALRREVVVQDEGSQLVASAVGARPGLHLLDLCAAPGGKTALLWAAMEGRGLLVASDVRPSRVRLLVNTLAGLGLRLPVVALDGTAPLPFRSVFDRVFVDAPCSGLGTIRRDPDLKWRWAAADLGALARTQRAMLGQAAQVVTPGGALVYATCSSEPDENEAVVEAFLVGHPAFRLAPIMFSDRRAEAPVVVDARGYLRTQPDRDGLDAYFAALLVRSGSA